MKKKLTKKQIQDLANESILKSLRAGLIGDMKPEAFVYWLQGFLELENPKSLNARQTQIVKDHLALVFNKVTPDRVLITAEVEGTKSPHLPHFCSTGKIC